MNISQFYERYWERPQEIDSEVGLEVEPRQELLRKALRGLPKGAPILDAGCGAGAFSGFLAELGFQIVGVDISARAVALGRERFPNVAFHAAALEAGLPLRNELFKAVWCSEVLEHLFDVHKALSEINRVLQPGGTLVLTTPYHGLLKNLIIALKGYDQHYNPYLSHIRFFSRRSLIGCIERAGFRVERWGGIGRRWPVWKSQTVIARKVGPPGPSPAIIG